LDIQLKFFFPLSRPLRIFSPPQSIQR
jgi:hypothetical protein